SKWHREIFWRAKQSNPKSGDGCRRRGQGNQCLKQRITEVIPPSGGLLLVKSPAINEIVYGRREDFDAHGNRSRSSLLAASHSMAISFPSATRCPVSCRA